MSKSQQFINSALYPKKASTEVITGVWTHKSSVNDSAGLIADVTDTTGFAQVAKFKTNNIDWLYFGSIFGLNGLINLRNDPFFFGNSDAKFYFLLNPSANQGSIVINSNAFAFNETNYDIGSKDFKTTGNLTDGTVSAKAAHTHIGTAGEGNIIPHARTTPARSIGTTYSNAGARPIIVFGDILIRDSGGGTGFGYIDCKTDTNTPPTTIVQTVGNKSSGDLGANTQVQLSFFFVVQPGHRYLISSTTSNVSLTMGHWNEVDF